MLKITREKSRPRDSICKRPYVTGTTLRSECPECGQPWSMDLGKEYVEQCPLSGEPLDVESSCSGCDHEWSPGQVAYVLGVKICP